VHDGATSGHRAKYWFDLSELWIETEESSQVRVDLGVLVVAQPMRPWDIAE
jgi:hypothetical protein